MAIKYGVYWCKLTNKGVIMKTVMDAVIEFRGSIGAAYDGGLYILYHTEVGTYSLASIGEYERLNYFCNSFTMVCPLNTFNATVTLLSHAPWIKGASLEEYQAADKEVLKMENKTVEVDGMIYEIGKDYEFSDNKKEWLRRSFDRIRDTEYPFSAEGECFKYCREINAESLGAITPAPAKLIDGSAYMFRHRGSMMLGFKFGEYMTVGASGMHPICDCEDIMRMVPDAK